MHEMSDANKTHYKDDHENSMKQKATYGFYNTLLIILSRTRCVANMNENHKIRYAETNCTSAIAQIGILTQAKITINHNNTRTNTLINNYPIIVLF